jgi:4-amino-4-deoxy-L-arabinose transferase-like glycosyltransferase
MPGGGVRFRLWAPAHERIFLSLEPEGRLLPMRGAGEGWRATIAGESAPAASIRRLLWLWIVVTVAVFSFSQTKEDLYILPAVPALAVLAADSERLLKNLARQFAA